MKKILGFLLIVAICSTHGALVENPGESIVVRSPFLEGLKGKLSQGWNYFKKKVQKIFGGQNASETGNSSSPPGNPQNGSASTESESSSSSPSPSTHPNSYNDVPASSSSTLATSNSPTNENPAESAPSSPPPANVKPLGNVPLAPLPPPAQTPSSAPASSPTKPGPVLQSGYSNPANPPGNANQGGNTLASPA